MMYMGMDGMFFKFHSKTCQPRLSRKLEEEASDRRQCEQRTAGAFFWAVLGVPKTTLSKD